MPVYELEPHGGVGPVRLGASRDEVRSAVSDPPDPFRKDPSDPYEVDAFDSLGLHVHYAGDRPAVEFIEASEAEGVSITLGGTDLLRQSAAAVVAVLASRSSVVEEEEGSSFVAPALDVSLWRSSPDDEAFESVGVGAIGYFGGVAV